LAVIIAFALMTLATAAAMLRKSRTTKPAKPAPTELPVEQVIVEGLVVGAVTGLVGSGGGFLVVPAPALLGGLPMSVAVGTSLLVIAMKSFSGLDGVQIDWNLALLVTAAAVVGGLIGSRYAVCLPQDTLRKPSLEPQVTSCRGRSAPTSCRGTGWARRARRRPHCRVPGSRPRRAGTWLAASRAGSGRVRGHAAGSRPHGEGARRSRPR
jgi:hypothetical protein